MEDDVAGKGAPSSFNDEKSGAVLLKTPVVGIVKHNIDSTRTGRIKVFINKYKGTNQDDENSWVTVNYLSPFFGYTPNTGSKDANGTFSGNPNSYGFWATPPDVGTQVLCVFENGDENFGYYIGSVVKSGLNHMVPAIGSTDKIIANGPEAKSYGGAIRLPVAEFNNANEKQSGAPDLSNQPRPIHSSQAAILNKQGLLRDADRGTIGSSSVRETPSRVFGMSTPGRPIYDGGFDDSTIKDAVNDSSVPDSSFKVTGRQGGHSFVMDDGDVEGRDQLLRLRTSSGHMIMMNDSAQVLLIMHSSGQSYIEFGKEGTIDMYSTNSVNVRTQGDLNLHADRNMNIHVEKDLSIRAENIRMESKKETSHLVGTDFKQNTKANHAIKVDGTYAMKSGGPAGMTAGGDVFIKGGPNVNLNTGEVPLSPAAVSPITENSLSDTLNDGQKGYASAAGKLKSITNRAPTHFPWEAAGMGVDVKVNLDASANFPEAPAPAVAAANDAAPSAPENTTSPALTATVPAAAAASPTLDKTATSAMVSQMAVNAATGPAADIVKAGAGVATTVAGGVATTTAAVGSLALTPQQLETAGYVKPGAGDAIAAAVQNGKSIEQAIPPNMLTGKDGVKSIGDLAQSIPTQTKAATDLLAKSESMLKSSGLISGKESPTQTGGLIMATASLGLKAASDFMKSASGGLSSLTSGLGLDASKVPNPLGGDVKNLVSGGNFATKMADKALSGLAGLGDSIKGGLDSAKGAAAAAFESVTSKFKDFKAGEPVSLAGEKAKVEAEATAATSGTGLKMPSMDSIMSGASTAVNKLGGLAPPGVKAALDTAKSLVPGATSLASSASSMFDKAKSALSSSSTSSIPGMSNVTEAGKMSVPGLDSITGSISKMTGSISNGTINSAVGMAKSALGKNSLAGQALSLLGSDPAAKLKGALGSLGVGGGTGLKLPTMSVAGFDAGKIAAKSKELMGDPKIPAPKFNVPEAPSADKLAAIAKAKDDFAKAAADEEMARLDYVKAKGEYPAGSDELKAAEEKYLEKHLAAYDAEKALDKA